MRTAPRRCAAASRSPLRFRVAAPPTATTTTSRSNRCRRSTAAGAAGDNAGGGDAANRAARDRLLALLEGRPSMRDDGEEVGRAVAELIATNRTQRPGLASPSVGAGAVWEVLHAPHISRLGALFGGATFAPIRYVLAEDGRTFWSTVRFSGVPFFGEGWLSASGTFGAQDEGSGEFVCFVLRRWGLGFVVEKDVVLVRQRGAVWGGGEGQAGIDAKKI